MANSYYYKIGPKNQCFSKFLYWRWYFYAVWQSFAILIFTFQTLEGSIGQYNDYAISGSLTLNGTFIIETICILANIKVMVSTNSHNLFSIFCQVSSIGMFYVQYVVESS